MSLIRFFPLALALVVMMTSLACAGDRDRMKQPLAPAPKLYCYSADFMSLSSTVLVSDACWRTCAARCGGRFETCVGASALNYRRVGAIAVICRAKSAVVPIGGPLLDITGPLVAFTD